MPSYDSESRKTQTKAVSEVSKGGRSGFWKLLYQGANDVTQGVLALRELGGRRK